MGRLSNRRGTVGTGSVLALQLAPRHYFYDRCNEILAEADFGETVKMLCQPSAVLILPSMRITAVSGERLRRPRRAGDRSRIGRRDKR